MDGQRMGDEQPTVRVVRGEPTPEELAVVTALVTVAGSEADEPTPPLRGRWNDPSFGFRQPLRPGPGAWRATVR
jgi:hypothetical protein